MIQTCDRWLHDSYYDVNQWPEDFGAREMSDLVLETRLLCQNYRKSKSRTQRYIWNKNQKHCPSLFTFPGQSKIWSFYVELFRRGRQRNVLRFITHVHSYCNVLLDESFVLPMMAAIGSFISWRAFGWLIRSCYMIGPNKYRINFNLMRIQTVQLTAFLGNDCFVG